MKFFKILPKENLNSACKRKVLQQKVMKKGVLRRPASSTCFPVNFAKFLQTTFSQNTSEQLLRLQLS